jgi:putative hydrolase of the HAD superfamily
MLSDLPYGLSYYYIKLSREMERPVMPSSIKILGIDADDTLWQNEEFFRLAQGRFADMLACYMPPNLWHEHLLTAERRKLGRYEYGIRALYYPWWRPRSTYLRPRFQQV